MFLALPILLVNLLFSACSSSNATGQLPTEEELPVAETSSGFRISLTVVEQTGDRTELTFRVEDADTDSKPSVQYYDGIYPPEDTEVEGIARSDSRQLGGFSPIMDESLNTPLPIVAVEQRLILGPPDQPDQPVMVTINRLRFRAVGPGQDSRRVDGEWSFTFTPADLGKVETTTVSVNQ